MNERARLRAVRIKTIEEISLDPEKVRKQPKHRRHIRRGSYSELMAQAGIKLAPPVWILFVVGSSLLGTIILYHLVGFLVALSLGPFLASYFLYTSLFAKAEKRRAQAIPHLPGFIDTLIASLRTGYNMELAVEHATSALPEGVLKNEFSEVILIVKKNMALEEALEHIVRTIAGQEILSLVITIRLFTGFGGRVLAPLQRLSVKMRTQQAVLERALRDMVSTKQAFYIILSLSVVVPMLLIASDPEYFLAAFRHPKIKYIMQAAVIVQVMCMVVFKKLTMLRM